MRVKDKVALITGCARGIGRVAALLFAREGAKVLMTDISEEQGEAVAAAIRSEGGQAHFVKTDVTDTASVRNAVNEAVSRFNRIDVLYNNAGGSTAKDRRVTEAPDEEFWRVINVDLFGTWQCCKYAIPEIVKAGGGSVINTSSIVAVIGNLDKDAYTCAKGAIIALTRSMAVEYAPNRIRVNAIAPGVTLTERVVNRASGRPLPDNFSRHLLGAVEPIDVASVALFLASDESRHLTGQTIAVDSGATIS